MLMTTAVIGGGASGMLAAIVAEGLPDNSVTIFERAPRLGRKLSVTGNGRCNLTNTNISPENYHGAVPEFALPALSAFGTEDTLQFFRSIGLVTVAEPGGRVYPFSDQAGSVLDVLRFALSDSGAEILLETEVTDFKRSGDGFTVFFGGERHHFDKVIVACGGSAGTRAGGCDLGYKLLSSLGHTRTALYPSLVQIKTDNTYTKPLKGVRADALVSVTLGGKVIATSAGEVQFTEYGVSGPAIFEVSRAVTTASGKAEIHLDLMRSLSVSELTDIMVKRHGSDLTLENLLTGTLHNKLGRTVISRCGFSLGAKIASLKDCDFLKIARQIKDYALPVTGNMGMDGAQVTAGGISCSEFYPETLESRIVPGLFAAGEVLDIDGDCGGYNLQWAWSSGFIAGHLGRYKHD
jgi:hypothetical protein